MMGLSISHLALLTLVIFILFGAGKLPQVMGDLARGIRAFKDQLNSKDSNNDPSA